MDRSVDDRNAAWRGESNRDAWNRERDDWQQRDSWRGRPGGEVERSIPGAAAPPPSSPFRGGWGNTGGFSESFYNRGMSPYEPGVGGLEPLESHWPSRPARGWAASPNAEWPNAAPRSVASAVAETERDWGRDDRAWSRQSGRWGEAPPVWSNRHAGIAETTWGGAEHRERDWGETPGRRNAGNREWGSQPDWSTPNPAAEGPYRGLGPQGYQRSDERIREDICDLLTERGDVDASAIQVRVENREVTLEGTVPDRRMKRIAEDIAEATRGVRDVHNRLRVESDRGDARSWTDAPGSRNARASSRSSRGAARGAARGASSTRSAAGTRGSPNARSGSRAGSRSSAGAAATRERESGASNARGRKR